MFNTKGITAKDLIELLNGVPDETPVFMLDSEGEIAYPVCDMGHFTDADASPAEGGYRINIAIIEKGGAVVLSDWEMLLVEHES